MNLNLVFKKLKSGSIRSFEAVGKSIEINRERILDLSVQLRFLCNFEQLRFLSNFEQLCFLYNFEQLRFLSNYEQL
jgi:hypothetical protein